MMLVMNTRTRYGALTILFHWLLAILVISNIIIGLYIVSLPDVGFNKDKVLVIFTHKEIGVLVLVLVIPRLLWRTLNVVPTLPSHLPAWQAFIAHAVHWILYGFMFAMPISGWLMSSSAGFTVSFMDTFHLPNLVSTNQNLIPFYISVHKWIAYGLIATMILHISAALRHHFLFRDEILVRMLKWW